MTEEPPKKAGMRRSVRILLVLSLALNLIVAGLIVGAVLSHGGKERHSSRPMDGPGSPIARALSWEDRREVGKNIRKAHRDLSADRKADQRLYAAFLAALRADPFVPEEMRLARDALDQASRARRQIATDIWAAHVEGMTVKERQDYATSLEKVLENRRHHGGKKKQQE